MTKPESIESETPAAVAGAATGSAENVRLPNDTKIRFCNALDALRRHWLTCDDCAEYIYWGEGDLCAKGKDIIAMELAYADTGIEFPPNASNSATGDRGASPANADGKA